MINSPVTRIIKNFTALGVVQLTNYILPLITIPYLTRQLGLELYGKVLYVQAITAYFVLIIDYGFNLTATHSISLNRKNPFEIQTIINTVYSCKLILFLISFFILAIIFAFQDNQDFRLLYLGGFFMIVGQTIFPVWFFQGMENMKYISYLNVVSKIIFTCLIFIFIKSRDSYLFILPIYGLGNLFSSVVAIFIMYRRFNASFRFVGLKKVMISLQESTHVFVSNVSISLYSSSNLVILGFFVTDVTLGYYGIAEKVLLVARQVLVIFSQAIFPQISILVYNSFEDVKKILKKIYLPFALLIVVGSLLMFFLSDFITVVLTGHLILEVSTLIKILSIVPVIVTCHIPFYQVLLSLSRRKVIMYSFVGVALISVMNNFLLSYFYQAKGSAISMVITELMITIILIINLEKDKKYSLIDIYKFS